MLSSATRMKRTSLRLGGSSRISPRLSTLTVIKPSITLLARQGKSQVGY